MPDYDFDIGIIGGGAAGLTVTAGAAQLGAKTLLIEKEKNLGGDCLHFGCVPSKTLIRTSHIYHLMKNAKRFGLPEVEIPPADFKEVAKRIQSVIDIIQEHDSVERFCKLGARVELGEPVFSDDHSVKMNGNTYSAKNWVIATGSSPAVFPIEGLDKASYITNREIFSLDTLPESMIVLGAGPIGIEMAQSFNRLGSEVAVVDLADQILIKEDRDMAEEVMKVLKDEGIKFHLGSSVVKTSDTGVRREVTIKTGDGNTGTLNADSLLLAIGRTPNIKGLGLEEIGVGTNKSGINVDSRLRTTQKHIYAAGDVAGGFQFTHTAGYEGGIVVSNAIFHLPRKVNFTNIPWCTYTDPELASIGMNEKMASEKGIEYSVWTEEFKSNDRSLAEGEHAGRIKLLLDKKDKPIGVQIFGPSAGELISEWVAIMNAKAKLSTIVSSIHPYPTLGEINKKVIGNLFSKKIYSAKVKKGLKFFFHLKGRACE